MGVFGTFLNVFYTLCYIKWPVIFRFESISDLSACKKNYQGFQVNLFIIHRNVYREIMLSKVLVGWGQRKGNTKVPVRKQSDKLSILCLATVTYVVTYLLLKFLAEDPRQCLVK